MKVIYEYEDYRIIETLVEIFDMKALKGDMFSPCCNPELPADKLKFHEKMFEDLVYREGVYGYQLQRWNPEKGKGWIEVDSCYGFIGKYHDHNHYIVDEFIEQTKQK